MDETTTQSIEAPAAASQQVEEREADFETRVRRVLEKVRPFLQMDGGDLELVAIEDKNVLVRLHGACESCSISSQTLSLGVDQALRRDIPDMGELIQVD